MGTALTNANRVPFRTVQHLKIGKKGTTQTAVCDVQFDTGASAIGRHPHPPSTDRAGGRPRCRRGRARYVLLARVSAIPQPETPVERLLLRGILLEFACRFGKAFHERFHRFSALNCSFSAACILEQEWSVDGTGRSVFTRWTDKFFAEIDRVHPPSIAERGSDLLRRDFKRKWTVAQLARALGVKRTRLTSAFQRIRSFAQGVSASTQDLRRIALSGV